MPDFRSALKAVQTEIESVLNQCLPKIEGRQSKVIEAMRYAALDGGKRLRPFLMIETAKMLGSESDDVWKAAAALESIHVYSLIHDDLPCMDDDDYRRGKPTVHKAYDEAIAVLAGDGLLTHAFQILSELSCAPETKLSLISDLALRAGTNGMIGGQIIDMSASESRRDEALITELQQLKTGALIEYAVTAGATLAGATSQETENLAAYAQDLGLIFQITDDILDIEGTAERVGKAVNKDENLGKATFVSILGLDGAKQKTRELADRAKGRLEPFGKRAQILSETIDYVLVRDQ